VPNITQKIKRLRKDKKFSQERLAQLANVVDNTIIKIEVGKNKNSTLDTLKRYQGFLIFQ